MTYEQVDFKCRVHDVDTMAARLFELTESLGSVTEETDTYFNCAHGRMKLRVNGGGGGGTLIFYERVDTDTPRLSSVSIVKVDDAVAMRTTLDLSNGICGEVRKTRRSFVYEGRARLYLDVVDGLGTFLEADIKLDSNRGDAMQRAADLTEYCMAQLVIAEEDMVTVTYRDLLHSAASPSLLQRSQSECGVPSAIATAVGESTDSGIDDVDADK